MALSWRASIPIFLGVIPLFFFPTWGFIVGWVVLCACLWAFDAYLAPSPRQLVIERSIDTPIAMDSPGHSRLSLRSALLGMRGHPRHTPCPIHIRVSSKQTFRCR